MEAWDLYASGEYIRLLSEFPAAASAEIDELRALAQMAIGHMPAPAPKDKRGLFAPLVEGIHARSAGIHKTCALLLGEWLLKKPYHTDELLNAFFDSAHRCGLSPLAGDVARRYQGVDGLQRIVLPALLDSLFAGQDYTACAELYEAHREIFATLPEHERKAAIALLHLRRYTAAEKTLLELYKARAGKDYTLDYDGAKKDGIRSPERIRELEKARRSDKEEMELGMAYLFSERYAEALRHFEDLLSRAESQKGNKMRDIVDVPVEVVHSALR